MPEPVADKLATIGDVPLQKDWAAVPVGGSVGLPGWVMVKVCVAVHKLASVAVTVQVPAVRPVTEVVPSPAGLPGVQS